MPSIPPIHIVRHHTQSILLHLSLSLSLSLSPSSSSNVSFLYTMVV
ncbi:hypothetical protein OAV88_00745 [bacterium]|nr:hypothetical protein [bacterium]